MVFSRSRFSLCVSALILSSSFCLSASAAEFVKLDHQGNELPPDAQSWQCVKDKTSNLVWEVKTESGLQDKNNRYNWLNSVPFSEHNPAGLKSTCSDLTECNIKTYVAAISAQKVCGYDNWRLPDIDELYTIVSPMKTNSIDMNYFPHTQGRVYISSSEAFDNDMLVQGVDFDTSYGDVFYKDAPYHVRLVHTAK